MDLTTRRATSTHFGSASKPATTTEIEAGLSGLKPNVTLREHISSTINCLSSLNQRTQPHAHLENLRRNCSLISILARTSAGLARYRHASLRAFFRDEYDFRPLDLWVKRLACRGSPSSTKQMRASSAEALVLRERTIKRISSTSSPTITLSSACGIGNSNTAMPGSVERVNLESQHSLLFSNWKRSAPTCFAEPGMQKPTCESLRLEEAHKNGTKIKNPQVWREILDDEREIHIVVITTTLPDCVVQKLYSHSCAKRRECQSLASGTRNVVRKTKKITRTECNKADNRDGVQRSG